MNNIDFFTKVSKGLDFNAEEITIVGSHVEENLFDAQNVPQEYLDRFLSEMAERFPEVTIEIDKLQQFSFQPADGIAYQEHKFMAVFSGGMEDCFLHPEIGVFNPHDDYCVNFFIESRQQVTKFYDLEIDRHSRPVLPKGGVPITHWGHGVSANPLVKDSYFLHPDVELVANHFGLPKPYLDEIRDFCTDTRFQKVFGLTYRTDTLAPLKLKLYFYPDDPNMEHTVFDEVVAS